jgi:hypothetical protein
MATRLRRVERETTVAVCKRFAVVWLSPPKSFSEELFQAAVESGIFGD